MKLRTILLILAGALLLGGCNTYRQSGPPHFTVDMSFLDYVTFTYYAAEKATSAESPVRVRVTLSGSGHIGYARGRSSRVNNDFWTEKEEAHVEDLFTDQVVIGKSEAQTILQALVDAGVFEPKQQGNHVQDLAHDYVFISARINQRRGIVITDAREFVEIYKQLVHYLYR